MSTNLREILLTLCALTFICTVVVSGQQNDTKNCDVKKFDKCADRLIMLGDKTFVFPENMEKMNKRCKEIKPLEKCLKDYSSKCLSTASKSTISVMAYSFTKTNKGYCTNNKRKNAFIALGSCANSFKKDLETLMARINSEFTAIITYKDSKLRVPLACCSFYKLKTNILDLVNQKCAEHSNEVELIIDGYSQDALNLLCGEYTEDSSKCSSIVSKIPKLKKQPTTKTFVIPMAEILSSV